MDEYSTPAHQSPDPRVRAKAALQKGDMWTLRQMIRRGEISPDQLRQFHRELRRDQSPTLAKSDSNERRNAWGRRRRKRTQEKRSRKINRRI
jgi:hypothetical protein